MEKLHNKAVFNNNNNIPVEQILKHKINQIQGKALKKKKKKKPDSAILSSLDSSFQNLEAQMAKAQ